MELKMEGVFITPSIFTVSCVQRPLSERHREIDDEGKIV